MKLAQPENQTKTLTIHLRGETFTADSPTDSEILGLASLFLPGDSEQQRIEALQSVTTGKSPGLFGIDLSDPRQESHLTATVVVRLMEPTTKARVSHVMSAMFPNLPPEWVSYRLIKLKSGDDWQDFRFKLSNPELLATIRDCLAFFMEAQPRQQSKGFSQPVKRK